MKRRTFISLMSVLAAAGVLTLSGCSSNASSSNSDSSSKSESAEAADQLAAIQASGKLIVALEGAWQPWSYHDESDTLVGYDVEVSRAIAEKLGVEPEFVEINWDTKVVELDAKSIDCIWNGMTATDELKNQINFSSAYMNNSQVAVIRKADAAKYKDLASMSGAKVVAEAGSAGEIAVKADAGLSKSYLPVKDQGTSLMEVKSKTADIAIIDAVTAAGSIGEGTDYDDLMIVDVISSADSEVYAVGIRKSDTELTAKINAAIKELYDDGTLAKLAEKYNLSGRVIAQ